MNEIISAIGAIGFPAVMCLLMHIDNREVRKDHKEEVTTLSVAIQNNTLVMQQILDKLDE